MFPSLPFVITGDSNVQLAGIRSVIRSTPERVQPILAPRICYMPPSDRGYEEYVFVSAVPKVAKRMVAGKGGIVGTIKQTINNDSYEVEMEIPGDDWDDDRIGAYAPIAQDLANSLMLAPDELVTTQLVARGESLTAFDGIAFYHTAHKWPGGENTTSQLNKQTGTGTDPDDIENDYWLGYNATAGWVDDRGRLKVPGAFLVDPASIIVQHSLALNQAVRRVFGTLRNGDAFDLVVDKGDVTRKSALAGEAVDFRDGYLTGNSWYIHFVGGGPTDRPFVLQVREQPQIDVLSRGSEWFKVHKTILIKGSMRFGLGVFKPERSQKIYTA